MLDTVHQRSSAGYTGRWNWGDVTQKSLHAGEHNTVADVLEYRGQALERIEKYNLLLGNIEGLLGFKVKATQACGKEENSSLRKLWDRNTKLPGKADHITDYLRAAIIVPEGPESIKNLERAINTLINHPSVVAYKDQFYKPEPETGFRSFKALLDVDGHIAELIIQHEGFLPAAKITEGLRHFERSLKEFQESAPRRCGPKYNAYADIAVARLRSNAGGMISDVRKMRTQVHDAFGEGVGLDRLLSPELQVQRHESSLTELATTFAHAQENKYFGKGLASFTLMLKAAFPALVPTGMK